ncbi:isopenicillin N synthase family oxygenase [Ferrimonas sediminicola]|uniref:2-oxoglutarate-dependent ethylene/succinate-forming enzyme n=1 Tax=Ferrimonas sediminicola TaxID=2569538 RepID=A0A4U1BHU7_9GAMM|nr:2OG-Fe(II) oxygenase family protein [Ferrimonas sediminicola]TKB51016.1 isopenicillin N synthase family oxygenase [Ferrimonas sediminicola]
MDTQVTRLEAVDFRSEDAAERFVESLRNTGFGVLKNHPLSQQRVQGIYDNWLTFFGTEEKHQFAFNSEAQDGYFAAEVAESAKGSDKRDIKEYYHYYPWGQCPGQLKGELQEYYDTALAFATTLLEWIERYTPEEVAEHYREPLPNMIEGSEQSLLRVLHYPPMTGEEEPGAIRAAAHEDINLITILPAANEPGLQVKGKDGQWLDVPCDFGNLIVNIGDMLQEASQGYFPSTTHRVINPGGVDLNRSRVSLPLFIHPRSEVVLSERHTAHSYLMERLRELGVI